MKLTVFFMFIVSFYGIAYAARKAANYVSEAASQRPDISEYKKIGTSSFYGLFGTNSKTQCSEVCLNEDSCESFYMDGGACVFGVIGDVNAFSEEGEEAYPNGNHTIQVKGD